MQLSKTDMLSKGLDDEVKETRSKIVVLESQMKEKNDTIRRLETSLSGYKRTHSQNITQISKLEEENKKVKEEYEMTSSSVSFLFSFVRFLFVFGLNWI